MACRLNKPRECIGCQLAAISRGFIEPEGTSSLGVALIGEAGGEHEANDGYPFRQYAEAGSLLNRAIGMAGFRREQFAISNILSCQPPRNELSGMPYEFPAIDHCRVHLLKFINQYKPKVILALGAVALRSLTGLAGKRLTLEYLRGYALESNIELNGESIPVISAYHPSFIKRGAWAMLPVLVKDIKFAVDCAKYGVPDASNLRYVTNATPGDLEALRDTLRANPDMVLSDDIETNYAEAKEALFNEDPELMENDLKALMNNQRQEITQYNFSAEEGTGLVAIATPTNTQLVAEIHSLENVKVGHNIWMFDKPVCEYSGVPYAGDVQDTMWLFHHMFPDLPGNWKQKAGDNDYREDGSLANLQFCASFAGFPLAWKHLSGSDEQFYGGCDADSALRVFWWIRDELERHGLLDAYDRMVHQLLPILERMRLRGIPVNRQTLVELHEYLTVKIASVHKEIQQHVPPELFPLDPPAGFKKVPKDTTGMVQIEVDLPAENKVCCMRARKLTSKSKPNALHKYMKSPRAHMRVVKGEQVLFAPNPECKKCGGVGTIDLAARTELRWARECEFNVASPNQMWGYVRYRGYKVGKNSKRKMSMDAETIDKLAKKTGDPIFNLCTSKRKLVKLDSTYVVGWMPGDDGRVHPQIGCYPATGQLSSRRPNSQNCFSGDTQVLTDIGWVSFDQLEFSGFKLVAQFDAETGLIDFVRPLECINTVTKSFINITTDLHIDLMVTPAHECLLRHRKRGRKWSKVSADQYAPDMLQYQAGMYVGGHVRLREAEVAIICALQADGHIKRDGGIEWGFSKQRKIDRLTWAISLTELPVTIRYSTSATRKPRTRITLASRDIPTWLKNKKHFSNWLLECDRETFSLFAREVWKWDGYAAGETMYSSSVRQNADWVQILISLSGQRARLRRYHNGNPRSVYNWQVDSGSKPYSLTSNLNKREITGFAKAYCVTMPKGTVIVRRNGNVAITGNCPSLSKQGELAVMFRRALYAEPGHIIIEPDFKSFHVMTLGYEAQDPVYIGLARTDIHSFFAVTGLLRIEDRDQMLSDAQANLNRGLADPELKARLKWYRKNYTLKNGDPFDKIRDEKAKVVVLAYGLGMMENTLFRKNEDSFSSVADAKNTLLAMDATFPKEKHYRDNKPLQVKPNGYKLVNRFGFIRWFFDVQRLNRRAGKWEHGDDWEAAIAFDVQADAHGHMRECIKQAEYAGYNESYQFDNTVHDSFRYHCPIEFYRSGEYFQQMKPILEHRSEYMPCSWDEGLGLSFDVEFKAGPDWGSMKEITI